TPLYHASYRGYVEIVAILIEAGADCRAKDEEGLSSMEPIHAGFDNVDVLRLFLTKDSKADINAPTADGSTPLILAARHGYESCIDALLQHGAD
ncbi:ankyrin repeat domain-containing protein, partial [Aspergillus glaucus CBS 516.65]